MWRLLRPGRALAVAAVALAATAAGCGSGLTAAEERVCDSLKLLGTALAGLRDLDAATATKEDVTTFRGAVEAAVAQVRQEAAALDQARAQALEDAKQALVEAIDAVPADATAVELLQQVTPQIEGVVAVRREIADGIGC